MPSTVSLQLTNRCNFRCIHCYQEHGGAADAKDELTLGEIERILGEIADCGVLLLVITGGEVFTRPDALDLVALAHRLGFAIRLKTNGFLLDEAKADALAATRPLQVDLSLYGADAATHDAVTRVRGSWDRVVAATRMLVARKIQVTLTTSIMESNAPQAGQMQALARDLGAQWTSDPTICPMTGGDLAPARLRMRWDTLRKFYAGDFGGDVPEELATRYAGADLSSFRPLDDYPCGAGNNLVTLSPAGEALPCNMLCQPAGSLRQHRFVDVWRTSPALVDLRAVRNADVSPCNVCGLRPFCRRCPAMALDEDGSLTGPSLEACRHAVAIRDFLRARGVVPAEHTALPPTWSRVDLDGQHAPRVEPSLRVCK
jgi:radical SAM protein with 4Fe4S-binding SPASM domain